MDCDPSQVPWSPPKFLGPWDSPGKNTGVGYHFLLQGIFPTQGLNPCLPHCRQILYHWATRGSPLWSSTALNSRLLPLPFFILLTASICRLLVKIQGFKTDFSIKESTARLEQAGGFSGGPVFKNPACSAGGMVRPLVWEDFTCQLLSSQLLRPHPETRASMYHSERSCMRQRRSCVLPLRPSARK